MKKFLTGMGICILVLLLLVGYVAYDDHHIGVTNYEIYSPKLPADFVNYKIAVIADFHNSYYYDKVVQRIKEQRPDLILFCGDMILLSENNYDNTTKLLDGINGVAPAYAITGNHEVFHEKLYQPFLDELAAHKIPLLRNTKTEIVKGNGKINLYGLQDTILQDYELYGSKYITNFKNSVKQLDDKSFNLLLMHRANLFPQVADCGFDLIVSGHLHGGLIRLPFIGGLVSPYKEWFPKYTSGINYIGQSKMITSRGMDYNLQKPRVFNGPELVMITLKK